MTKTIVQKLAGFAKDVSFETLPPAVVEECKRDILDSMGCALAAVDQPKGRIGIDYARRMAPGTEATIIGTADKGTILGAAFANGELINTLDFDTVLVPGHVSPYTLPGSMATAEAGRGSGRELIAATAVSHEMSYRFGKAMSQTRDVKDGKAQTAPVIGYAATIFGATAAVARLRGISAEAIANALGIAAATSPVNSHRAWLEHSPPTTIKYLLAGGLAQSAITAAFMAELGHRGDLQALDDAEFGYPRYIGTERWAPEDLLRGLGSDWLFPDHLNYKPYPVCRVPHASLDALREIVGRAGIKPDEIERLVSYGEEWAFFPSFTNRDIGVIQDAQFSFPHILAMAVHGVPLGKEWQDPKVVFSESVLRVMSKVELKPHPDWGSAVTRDPRARPSRVEVHARGEVFVGERNYPKGSPSPEPQTRATDAELIDKFRHNAEGVLSAAARDKAVDQIMNLEAVKDFSAVMPLLARSA